MRTRWAVLVLALAAWWVYGPAMNRVFVADHIWYFAELDGQTSLGAGLHHYDYAASRRYWKGDDALFRPLLFVWLAAANSLFSYHHVWWNIANLALHVLVAVCLFRLLMAIRPSPFALAGALLFVVMKPPLELVLWNHLGGYLLACAFLLIALRAWVIRLRSPKHAGVPPAVNAVYAAALTCAALSYESMVPTAVMLGVILLWVEYRRGIQFSWGRVGVLFLPVLVYGGLYVLHVFRVERLGFVDRPDGGDGGLFGFGNMTRAALAVCVAAIRWTAETALPSALEFAVSPYDRMGKRLMISFETWMPFLNIGLALAAIFLAGRSSLSRRHWKRSGAVVAAVLCALAAYMGLICVGRPADDVLANTYYLYPFCLLLVVLVYAVCDPAKLRGWSGLAAFATAALLVVVHAVETGTTTTGSGRINAAASGYVNEIARFVDRHKSEPDFSFRIADPPSEMDPDIELREGYPDAPASVFSRRVTQILFIRYYRDEGAKYVIKPDFVIQSGY